MENNIKTWLYDILSSINVISNSRKIIDVRNNYSPI